MSDDLKDLRARRAEIERQAVQSGRRGSAGKWLLGGGVAAAVALSSYAALSVLAVKDDEQPSVPVSDVQEFPEDLPVVETLETPRPVIVERPVIVTEPDSATLERLRDLEDELTAARAALEAGAEETAEERALREQIEAERNASLEQIEELRRSAENDQQSFREGQRELERQIAALQSEMESQRANAETERVRLETEYERRLAAAREADPLEQERLRAEEERMRLQREEWERLQAEQAAAATALEQRITSGLIAVANTGAQEAGATQDRRLSANEAFVRRGVDAVPVARAERIANPSATILQGTIIQASLETAIDSSLPGAIRAIVAEDVHSLDGSSVLIPAGSRVFGEYSAGIALGQRRVLIVWTRILTPANRSINIASYGADQLGRSGTGGVVDTRFGERFLGAAAISLIAAGPAIAANHTDDEDLSEAIEDVGSDLTSATSSAVSRILSIPPTIYVRQGASVSIILDRDLEIF